MSAPVVAAWVWTDEDGRAYCGQSYGGGLGEPDDRPALAVPDAAWTDPAFNDAVRERLAWNYGHVSSDMMAAFLTAIHAELRARAGGAA